MTAAPGGGPREQSRARYPDTTGYVERDGVRVFYEVYGDAGPSVLLVPPWSIVHSRAWKMQVPFLARGHRVIVFDPRGNGRSDRPSSPAAYAEAQFAADALAVLDATGTEHAVVVTLSIGAQRTLLLAAGHPARVRGIVFIAPALRLAPGHPHRQFGFDEELDSDEGWRKYNKHYWRRSYDEFLRFFFAQCASEPHSTKLIEDAVGWGLGTDPETLIATKAGAELDRRATLDLVSRLDCPVLVIHGDEDAVVPHAVGRELAALTDGEFVSIQGGGHLPHARDPVRVNLLIREFLRRTT